MICHLVIVVQRQVTYGVRVGCTYPSVLVEDGREIDWSRGRKEGEQEGQVFEAGVETLAVEGHLTVCCVADDESFVFVMIWSALG